MPSDAHQWLVVWLSRRINGDGFSLVGADAGRASSLIRGTPLCSVSIGVVRPDVIGVSQGDRSIAFGEAKTAGDLNNAHTWNQLAVMLGARDSRGRRPKVYLAFPSSCLKVAAKSLMKVGLQAAVRVTLVPIPDVLLMGRCG